MKKSFITVEKKFQPFFINSNMQTISIPRNIFRGNQPDARLGKNLIKNGFEINIKGDEVILNRIKNNPLHIYYKNR